MKRAEYGSLKSLTKEEYRQYKAQISKRWRESHKESVSAYNSYWYNYNKLHPRHKVRCKVCGKEFKSYRKTAKICPTCLAMRKKGI